MTSMDHVSAMGEAHCVQCGAVRGGHDAVADLAWVAEREGRATRWICPDCARHHVRDMESKLPMDEW